MNLQIKRPDHLGTYEGEHYPNNVVVGGQYLLVNIVWGEGGGGSGVARIR